MNYYVEFRNALLLQTHMSDLKEMDKFGLSESLGEAIPVARKYALLLYGRKKREDGRPCTTLDELRYVMEINNLMIIMRKY